jgi:hypothetical protein
MPRARIWLLLLNSCGAASHRALKFTTFPDAAHDLRHAPPWRPCFDSDGTTSMTSPRRRGCSSKWPIRRSRAIGRRRASTPQRGWSITGSSTRSPTIHHLPHWGEHFYPGVAAIGEQTSVSRRHRRATSRRSDHSADSANERCSGRAPNPGRLGMVLIRIEQFVRARAPAR